MNSRMIAVVLMAAAVLTSGCTKPDAARAALASAGYADIQTKGYSWFSCGRDDTFATEFVAKGPSGIPVEGAVCAGLFKGSTIRTF